MQSSYTPLQPDYLTSLGAKPQDLFSATPALGVTTSLVATILFMFIGGAAFYRYGMAGLYRMESSDNGIRKSNEAIRGATLGILGIFIMFLFFFTFNRDMIRSDIGLSILSVGNVGNTSTVKTPVVTTGGTKTTTTSSKSCQDVDTVKQSLQTPGGICANTQCRSLLGCNYFPYLNIAKEEANAAGIDYRLVVAVMCRESGGRPNPPVRIGSTGNADGSVDCGLMQINSKGGTCSSEILDPRNNIKEGVRKLKSAMSSTGRVYQNVPQIANALAGYNCCANGTRARDQSVSCSQENGFNTAIPKWACPIDPGQGVYNMCAVKDYACEITSCMSKIE